MQLSYILKGMWTIKYRPDSFATMALNGNTRKTLMKWVRDGEFPNLLLCSRPGMGKTTLAKTIGIEFECDTLFLNISDEGNVETIRTKVKDFAMTASLNGKMKLVILDEADGFANIQSQKILRGLMEEVADTCRFIITANYRHKIIEPIISRCVELDMSPCKKEMIRRCVDILKSEKVDVKTDFRKLPQLIDAFYPDMRSVVKHLQECVDESNVLKIKEFSTNETWLPKLVNIILAKDAIETRKFVIMNEPEFNGDYNMLLLNLYKYIIDNEDIDGMLRTQWTVIIAEYLYRMTSAIDHEICMAACIAEMTMKLNK